MPILYSMDINFDITIPDFIGTVNISGTNNKAQNEANGEGTNNNGQGGTSDNNKDNNNREDVGSIKTQGGQ